MLISSGPRFEVSRCNKHAQNFDVKAADVPPHWKRRTTQQRRSRQQRKRSPTRAGPKVRLKANRGPSTSRSSCPRNQLRVNDRRKTRQQASSETSVSLAPQDVTLAHSFSRFPAAVANVAVRPPVSPEHVVSQLDGGHIQ